MPRNTAPQTSLPPRSAMTSPVRALELLARGASAELLTLIAIVPLLWVAAAGGVSTGFGDGTLALHLPALTPGSSPSTFAYVANVPVLPGPHPTVPFEMPALAPLPRFAEGFAPGSPVVRARPQIALVFDDLGYSTQGLSKELLEIDAILSFAVLPGLPFSAAFAESARAYGHEVILHLPMEPEDISHYHPGENALLVDLDLAENRRRLRLALDDLPFFSGVSNHMGSRFTAFPQGMQMVMEEMRRRDPGLFFLDSRTTPYSVVTERAERVGVPCLRNSLFLDGREGEGVVPATQVGRLARIARHQGAVIGIGHVRGDTIEAVREAVEDWKSQGFELVSLSRMLRGDEAILFAQGDS